MTLKKGWCPSLARPMATGDGLLVRLYLRTPQLSTTHAQIIARLAQQYGNGQIDITARGSIQLRGVRDNTYRALYNALQALNLTHEQRTPRPAAPAQALTLGWHNNTLTLGVPYGRLSAEALLWVASLPTPHLIITTQRALIMPEITHNYTAQALEHGFMVQNTDARRWLEVCTGAPACSSALADTRLLAQHIAAQVPHLQHTVHISGCAKGCAYRHQARCTVVAQVEGYNVVHHGKAQDAPHVKGLLPTQLVSLIQAL